MKIQKSNAVITLFILIIILSFVSYYYANKINYKYFYKMELTAVPNKIQNSNSLNNTNYILYWTPFWERDDYYIGTGYKPFQNCTFKNCYGTANKSYMPVENYDALIFHASFERSKIVEPHTRRANQMYILMNMEAPVHVFTNLTPYNSFFNWTMSYRFDSDIPYRRRGILKKGLNYVPLSKEQLAGKTKLAAWFVSHCKTRSQREVLVKEIQKYIPVDIYGKCGTLNCSKHSKHCYDMVEKKYKFYLSFENAYCKDYGTEKLYNILRKNIVPVMYSGSDCNATAPPYSTINVKDFENAKDLADYLIYLDKNDDKYLEYFEWKLDYYIEPGSTFSTSCELCKKLNKPIKQSIYKDVDSWLRGVDKSYCKLGKFLPKIVSDLL